MLGANNLSLKFGARSLFDKVTFQLYESEKIGLVGKNGVGKTTLFNILSDQISPTEGTVSKASTYRVGVLAQFFTGAEENTVKEEAKEVFSEYFQKKSELEQLEKQLAESTNPKILDQIESLNAYFSVYRSNPEKEIEQALKGLGFKNEDLNQKMSTFSGGWKMRVELAKLLLAKFDLILLDEPTNHLDIEAIIWFEKYLRSYQGSYILISHDVSFINNTVDKIFELSNQSLSIYKGNYSKYITEKAERKAILEETVKNQQKKLATQQRLVDKFRAKATKAKFAKSLEKQIARTEIVELEKDDIKTLNLRFPDVQRAGREIFNVSKVSKYFGDKKVLESLDFVIERGDKIAFIGQNGTGKSTMLKCLIDELELNSGDITVGSNVNINYFAQDQADRLDEKLTVIDTLANHAEQRFSTSLRSILGAFLFSGEDVEKKVSVLSGGEKTRLAIACMIVRDSNVIIMDEPTNHLDIYSKEVLKQALKAYDGTVIVVSHDREFLTGLSGKTFEFKHGYVEEHLGDLEYVLQKRGMNYRELQQKKNTKSSESSGDSKKSTLSYEERKKLQRAVSNCEKKISKLETKIKEIHEKLMDPAIFKGEEGPKLSKTLSESETELDQAMESWEKAVEALEEAS